MKTGIYQIRNVITGKVYVGSTKDFKARKYAHLTRLRKGVHHSPHLQASWNTYGEGAFVFEALEPCSLEALLEREQHWIDALGAYTEGYNGRAIAESNRGRKATPEERKRMSAARKGKKLSPERCKAIGEQNRLRVLSDETKDKIRGKHLGKSLTQEHRDKVVKTLQSFKGQTHKESSVALIREARARQIITPEHAARVATANTGKRRSEEQRGRISESLKGHVCSEETRRKISESKKRKRLERLTKLETQA